MVGTVAQHVQEDQQADQAANRRLQAQHEALLTSHCWEAVVDLDMFLGGGAQGLREWQAWMHEHWPLLARALAPQGATA